MSLHSYGLGHNTEPPFLHTVGTDGSPGPKLITPCTFPSEAHRLSPELTCLPPNQLPYSMLIPFQSLLNMAARRLSLKFSPIMLFLHPK